MMPSTASQLLCRDVSRGVGHGVSLTGGKLSLLLTVDFLYTQIVVNFLNVTSWRGVWELHGIWTAVVFQDASPYTVYLTTCGFSFLFNVALCLLSPHLDRLLVRLPVLPRIILSRLFTVIHFINYMLLWRSFWEFFTMVFVTDFSLILSFILTTIVFVGFGAFNTLNGVPASVELDMDTSGSYCTVATLFQDRDFSELSRASQILWVVTDALCTGVLEVLGVLAWYGVYNYVVLYLPTAPQVTLLVSDLLPILLGFLCGLLAIMLQTVTVVLVEQEREEGKRLKRRRAAHFLVSCLGLVSSVLYWSGGWSLLDSYLLPDQPLASNLLCAVVGLAGLVLLGVSRSLHGGLSRDGVEEEAYPLQPYYFLALIRWQYSLLEEGDA